jgi:hypothetical protein
MTTQSPTFHCGPLTTCAISWGCPGGKRPLSWLFGVDNYKGGLTDIVVTGVVPTDAGDGFIVFIKNWSIVENSEWHVGLVCADAH